MKISYMAAIAVGVLLAPAALAQSAPQDRMPPMVRIAAPAEPDALPLYPKGAPAIPGAQKAERWNSILDEKVVRNVTVPTVTPFLPAPEKATGAAVIVAPGGAFLMLSMENEGWPVAQWLADHGIAAFVLKYRLEPTPEDEEAASAVGMARLAAAAQADASAGAPPSFQPSIDDGVAAVKFVRDRAAQWGVDPKRIGMLGFSAGAMTALGVVLADQPESRPDFVGLIYGPMYPAAVPADAPPLFAALAADDPLFGKSGFGLVEAWRKLGRPAEFHLYQAGGHGFGLKRTNAVTGLWRDEFLAWLELNKLTGVK